MEIAANDLIAPILALWLPFVRILAFLTFCPILDNRALPKKAKILLAIMLSMLMTPHIAVNPLQRELMSVSMLLLTGEQILWGWLFGHMCYWVFWALQAAGAILSMNMGLGMAVMNDPANGSSTMVISQIIYVYSALLFFGMEGHLLLVTILHKGFVYWPIGQAINDLTLRTFATGFSWILTGALLLALPTLFIMLLVQGVFGLLNRVSPTLNLFSLGFPISMLFGLFCLWVLSGSVSDHYLQLTNRLLALFDSLRRY